MDTRSQPTNKVFLILFIISISYTSVTPSKSTFKSLKVVSGFDLAHTLYERIRRTRDLPYPPRTVLDLTYHNEKRICEDIFGNAFFSHKGKCVYETPAEATDINAEVPEDRPRVSKSLTIGPNPNSTIRVGFFGKEYTIEESVITCSCGMAGTFGWSRQVSRYRYYVSNEYNFSEEPGAHIAGRFIFTETGGRILPRAIAEQAATVQYRRGYNLEHHYLQIRQDEQPAKNQRHDPLCGARLDVKVRICTAVFTSDFFDEEWTFQMDKVGGECDKRDVAFGTDEGRAELGNRELQEWAMHCQPNQEDVDFNYYLTRSYRPDEVIVHVWDKYVKKLVPENLSAGVRLKDSGVFLQYADVNY